MQQQFGPYRLERLLGQGGMGEVYRAVDVRKNRVVALKRLPASLARSPQFQARFRHEAQVAARLNEPHIVPIHDYGEIDGQLFLDMRLVEGVDLSALLARDGPLSPRRAAGFVAQAASALDAAHHVGLIHRDVKPSNLLVAGPAADFVYLIDFGIARVAAGTHLTSTGMTVGTMAYMAPERFGGAGEGDHRVDVYALSCVLYEALTGSPPFPPDDVPRLIYAHLHTAPPRPSEHHPAIGPALDAVVARGMAKVPDSRFASAGELSAAALQAIAHDGTQRRRHSVAQGKPAPSSPAARGTWEADGAKNRTSSRRLALISAIAIVVITVATVVVTRTLSEKEASDAAPSPTGRPSSSVSAINCEAGQKAATVRYSSAGPSPYSLYSTVGGQRKGFAGDEAGGQMNTSFPVQCGQLTEVEIDVGAPDGSSQVACSISDDRGIPLSREQGAGNASCAVVVS